MLTCVPRCYYSQGTPIPNDAVHQQISFAMADANFFPAELALFKHCDPLVDGSDLVFTEQAQTINLRIEVSELLSLLIRDLSECYVHSGQGTTDGGHR